MLFPREDLERGIPDRFERIAAAGSDRLAVTAGDQALTYGALNAAANRLARAIDAAGGSAGEPVALLVDHDAAALVAILAALKAARIYLALDVRHPVARGRAMLADAGAAVLVTGARHMQTAGALAAGQCRVLVGDEVDPSADASDLARPLDGRSLAFLGYTSGSTGEPKGVLWDHRGILHRAMCHVNRFALAPGDRLSLVHRLGLGASFRHTWGAMLSGATACLYDLQREGVDGLGRWLARMRVSHAHLAASVFRHLAATLPTGTDLPDLRLLWVGNEPVFRSDVDLHRARFSPVCVFVNGYAASEAGTVAEMVIDAATVLDDGPLPIGHALPDKDVLVLDDAGRPLPPGATGELAVRSQFLARGYWRRPDLDARVFGPDPAGGADRVYRTGDLGRLRADGSILHLGRKAELPKLRGHMVDPLEVERRLVEHPRLAGAAVVVREDRPGDQRLVAYLVATAEGAPSPSELRAFAGERLPEHLVPSTWVVLPALPRSGTGKLDRNQLPAPGRERPALDAPLVAPRTPIERRLARIWAEALALDEVGVDDSFLELGGHSLIAARIVSDVGTAFAMDMPGSALFDAASVSAMAAVVAEQLVRALAPEARDRLFADLADGDAGAPRPAMDAAGQSAAAADAPAPAQWSHIRAARATDSSTSSSSM